MRTLLFSLAIWAIAKCGATVQVKSYQGYQVLSIDVNSKDDLVFLKSLTADNELDFWQLPRLGGQAQIMATKEELAHLQSLLEFKNISSRVIIPDVGSLLATEKVVRGVSREMTWDAYYTWATIEPWILALEYNENADVTVVGKSSEGRQIYMVKVSTGPSSTGVPKKAIFIDANVHAREWVAVASVTWVINEIITNPADHAELLDAVDVYVIPMANPDGYVYTETDRMWRKTRSVNTVSPDCRGVDPNRNFEFMWGGEGTSNDPCSQVYAGPAPWSEPEVRAIRDAQITIARGGQEVQASISVHSCGNVWLLSWGWTEGIYPEDYADLEVWGNNVVESVLAVDGTQYQTGQGADLFSGVGGASDDYAKSAGIKYATTAELRCGPENIFILPAEEIIPTSQEVLAAIEATGRTIVTDLGDRKGQ